MTPDAQKAMNDFLAAMHADDCTVAEVASVLHSTAYDLVANHYGREKATEWAERMNQTAHEIESREASRNASMRYN